jgi:hypothetical protein
MDGITINGENINIFLHKEDIKEVMEELKGEGKVNIYRAPRKSKNWTPNKLRSSKVRHILKGGNQP